MDSRYSDTALVDPELPSSWRARNIAIQLSKADEAGALASAVNGQQACPTMQRWSISPFKKAYPLASTLSLYFTMSFFGND